MHVPVHAGAGVELGVGRGEEEVGEPGRDVGLDEGIAEGGEYHFVDVEWEGGQAGVGGEGFGERDEERGWAKGEWVEHFGGGEVDG